MVPTRRNARTTKTSVNGVMHVASGAVAQLPLHTQLGLDGPRLREMYETMLLARAVDERQDEHDSRAAHGGNTGREP